MDFSYVYTDEACLTLENVSSALYLSNKYFVTGLYNECLVFLKQNLSAENVCDFLGTAELFEELPEVYVYRLLTTHLLDPFFQLRRRH